MVILGIDPGYAILGYGVVDAQGAKLRIIDYGVVETSAKVLLPERLERIYAGVSALLDKYAPDEVAFEELFFYRNVTTAIQVGAGRGVALLAVQQKGLPLYEYTPMQIKLAVTGNGHADKQQVQHMVRAILNLSETPRPDDAADALAVAIRHANTGRHALDEFRIK